MQTQVQSLPISRPTTARRPLEASLSLPLDSYYHTDPTTTGTADTAFLPLRLPAPKLAARRTQSIGETTTLYQGVCPDVPATFKQTSTAAPTRYKTELCRPFEENGVCRYGSKCQFAHGKAELRSVVRHPKYKTDLCRTFHTTGLCPYGPRCHFIHNDDERRSSSESSTSEPMRPQLAAVQEMGRSSTSIARNLEERPRLQRQHSEYQPRAEPRQRGIPVPGNARTGPGVDLQRRASSVADVVIRNSIGYQRQLPTVLESDQLSALNINTTTTSMGSVADSSSASSITDSPSPSPTTGLLLPAAEDSVAPTATIRQAPGIPAVWSAEDDHARTALLTELVARLGPQDIEALIRALQQPGNSTSPSSLFPRGVDGSEVDATVPQWPADAWTQFHHHQYQHQYQQQQQQHGAAASNVCW